MAYSGPSKTFDTYGSTSRAASERTSIGMQSEDNFSQEINMVASKVQALNNIVKSMDTLVNQCNYRTDTMVLFDDMDNKQRAGAALSKELEVLASKMKNNATARREDKFNAKLISEQQITSCAEAIERFRASSKVASQKQHKLIEKSRAVVAMEPNLTDTNNPNYGEGYDPVFDPVRPVSQQTAQAQAERNASLLQIQQREKALYQIESDIQQLNSIFVTLASSIHDQQAQLDDIEHNIVDADHKVESGLDNLQKARNLQAASRRKLFCIILIIVVVLAIVGTIIGVSLKR